VPIGVGKHESPPRWTVERLNDDSNLGINKPIVHGLGDIGFEPEAPIEGSELVT
jgi:hypothetical protein